METFQEKQVQLALDKLGESGLFLDKLFDKEGQYIYYAVRHFVSPDVEPFIVVDWRYDLHGHKYPRPLSLDLIDQVRAQEGSMKEAFDKAMVDNAVKKELHRQEFEKTVDELAEDARKRERKNSWSYAHWMPHGPKKSKHP